MSSYWEQRPMLSESYYYGNTLPSFERKGVVEEVILERKKGFPFSIGRLLTCIIGAPLFALPIVGRHLYMLVDEVFAQRVYTQIPYVNPVDMAGRLKDVVLALRLIRVRKGDAELQEIESIGKMYRKSSDALTQHEEGKTMPFIAFLDAILDKESVNCKARLYPQISGLFLDMISCLSLAKIPEAERGEVIEKAQAVFRKLQRPALRRMPILKSPLPKTVREYEVFCRRFDRQEKNLSSAERRLTVIERKKIALAIWRIQVRITQDPLGRVNRNNRQLEAKVVSREELISAIARKESEIQLKTLYPAIVGILSGPRAESDLMALLEEYYPFAEKPSNLREVKLALLTKWRDALHATQLTVSERKMLIGESVTLGEMRGLLMAQVDTSIAKISKKKRRDDK